MGTQSISQVFQGHRHQSGFVAMGRHRIKEVSLVGTATAGLLDIFDTDAAPESGTYAQSGTTVTVTDTGHGLSTGDIVGISFSQGTGGTAQPGNYEITVTTANAFTVTMLNSNTITGTPACRYVATTPQRSDTNRRWLMSKHTAASDTFANTFSIPNQGFIVTKGIYLHMANLLEADVFFE